MHFKRDIPCKTHRQGRAGKQISVAWTAIANGFPLGQVCHRIPGTPTMDYLLRHIQLGCCCQSPSVVTEVSVRKEKYFN